MKTGENIIKLAWILLVVLAVGTVAIVLGKPSTKVSPLSTNFAPGGAAAFAELLRREGYKVEIIDNIPTAPAKDALVISFLERDQITLDTSEKKKDDEDDTKPPDDPKDPSDSFVSAFRDVAGLPLKYITNQVKAGGSALVLGYENGDIGNISTTDSVVKDSTGRQYSVTASSYSTTNSDDLAAADASFPAWKLPSDKVFANIDSASGGMAAVFPQGEFALNEYIDQKDNAKLLVDAVHLMSPAGGKIQIIDGSVLGAGEAGLLDVLGPWSHGIEAQVILLFIVIVYTLGKRFGIADETARKQRGARDLLDGIADTYARSKAGKAALGRFTLEADRSVRRYMKLPAEAPIRKRNEMLPQSVAQALSACEYANTQEPSPEEALELARRLETELEVFMSRRRISANKSRRRVKSA